MRQTWDRLLFAHWPVPYDALRPLVPAALELERYEGEAWLGVVPFLMRDVRPRLAPAVPWLSAFPELNVRTYVTAGGKPGVYFFSLDAGNPLAVELARRWFHLPYFHARFAVTQTGATMTYRMTRIHRNAPSAKLDATYRPTGLVYSSSSESLDAFLTERYCLYTTDTRGRLMRGEIHHEQWPLQPAEAEFQRNTMAQAAGLTLPAIAPLLHYAHHIEVLVWALARVAGG
jgi:uncharacterized protein YqjF (DUF2071 family)